MCWIQFLFLAFTQSIQASLHITHLFDKSNQIFK